VNGRSFIAALALAVLSVNARLAAAADWRDGAVELPHMRTERTRTYRLPSGVLATTSEAKVERGIGAKADAAATGPSLPGTCADATGVGTITWSNPSNALTNNGVYAQANLTSSDRISHYLKCTNFGFSLAASQTVIGITVEFEAKRSGSGTLVPYRARIVNEAGTIGTTDLTSTLTPASGLSNLTTSDTLYATGGEGQLWGESWLYSDINDADFGAAIAFNYSSGSAARNVTVDRMQITVFHIPPRGRLDATGFDTCELDVNSTSQGSPSFSATSPIHGRCSVIIGTSNAGDAEEICRPESYLDVDVNNRVYSRANIVFDSSALAEGNCMTALRVKQTGDKTGCIVEVCRSSSDLYTAHTWYIGDETSPLDYGEFSFPARTAPYALGLDQINDGVDQLACQPSLDGTIKASFYLTAAVTNCGGLGCEIKTACIGTPGTTRGANDGPIGGVKYDDFVIGNNAPIGVGYVAPLTPTGDVLDGWSEAGCTNGDPYLCIDDWASGSSGRDSCAGETSGSGTRIQSSSDLALTTVDMTDLDVAATESIRGLHYYGVGCSDNNTASTAVWPVLVSNSVTDVPTASTTFPALTGTTRVGVGVRQLWIADPGTACTTDANCTSLGTTCNLDVGFCNWNETRVSAVQAGVKRSGSAGQANYTAVIVYADVQTPAPEPRQNLQDCPGGGSAPCDGQITVGGGCDSLFKGTNTGYCTDGAGLCTQSPCPGNGCPGTTGQCVNGTCRQYCETNSGCDCGVGAVCQTANMIANQVISLSPQIDNMFVCAMDERTIDFWKHKTAEIVVDPYAAGCQKIKGEFGHCELSGNPWPQFDCAGDTVIKHNVDYVLDFCGGNDGLANTIGDCNGGTNVPTNRHGQRTCPQATTSPGAYQSARVECTGQAADYCTNNVGAGSVCAGYCDGHADPVKACSYDSECSECSNDPTRWCRFANYCIPVWFDGNGKIEVCGVDGDCTLGGATCTGKWDVAHTRTYPYTTGAHTSDVPCGVMSNTCNGGSNAGAYCDEDADCDSANCNMCDYKACKTDHKYCTIPCSKITCTTDADCQAATNGLGGRCSGGTCTDCGEGVDSTLPDIANDLIHRRWNLQALGNPSPSDVADRKDEIQVALDAAGARYYRGNYGLVGQVNLRNIIGGESATTGQFDHFPLFDWVPLQADIERRRARRLLDNLHYQVHVSHRGTSDCGGDSACGDGLHPSEFGAYVYAQVVAAALNTEFPVCSAEQTKPCGGCLVSCTYTTPTPTPGGECGPGTCDASGLCTCANNSQCPTGFTCESYIPNVGAGTPTPTPAMRCVGPSVDECPDGNNVSQTELRASNRVCATRTPGAGTCTDAATALRCADDPLTTCVRDSDCPSGVCSTEGSYVKCGHNSDCRSDGHHARDVCVDDLCRAPTPVP
jgi:hypothetical protein